MGFEQKTNLNFIKSYVKIKIFAIFVMPSEDTEILQFNQYQKSGKTPSIIYVGLES